ncbi:MAG: PKD domain-containing protein [Solirubrobacteraceae bacterium]|nr:PKD domain-containing protein [Solirubrobacteraceae bacterium]
MITTRSRTVRRTLALPLSGAVLLLSASGVMAKPIGIGDPPLPVNHAPVAKLKVTPKVALVSTLPELAIKSKGGLDSIGILGTGGDIVRFDASASTDSDDDALTFDWDLNGDGVYELLGEGPKQQTRYYKTGTFATKVRVSDGMVSKVDNEDVLVHRAPNAKLVSDEATPLVGQTVNYDAGASTADPSIASVAWDLDGDGSFETDTGTTLTASSSYQTPGPRTIKVKITDVYGETDTAALVEKVNQLPTASFVNGPAVAGTPVAFDGSASTDDSAITNYAWDLDDNGSFETNGAASPLTSTTFPAAGTRTVRLRVTDDLGAVNVVSRAVVVAPAPVKTGPTGQTGTLTGTNGPGAGTPLSDEVAPLIKLSSKTFKLSKAGQISIRIACPKGEVSCKGTVKIRIGKKRVTTIATAKFIVVGGQAKTVKLTIPASKRKAIRRGSKLGAKAIIAVADAAGNQGSSTTSILIGR